MGIEGFPALVWNRTLRTALNPIEDYKFLLKLKSWTTTSTYVFTWNPVGIPECTVYDTLYFPFLGTLLYGFLAISTKVDNRSLTWAFDTTTFSNWGCYWSWFAMSHDLVVELWTCGRMDWYNGGTSWRPLYRFKELRWRYDPSH